MNLLIRRILLLILALPAIASAIYSYRYLVGLGPSAAVVAQNLFSGLWLDVHVAGAGTALLLVSFQFLLQIRRTGMHRYLGRVYVVACLVGGTSGLFLAAGSTAGPIGTVGFGSLAIVWLATTALGWRAARGRRFDAHRRWMIRSFSLTFAAVTLRLYLLMIPLLAVDSLVAYRAISFLCWLPNLVIAEAYLRSRAGERAVYAYAN